MQELGGFNLELRTGRLIKKSLSLGLDLLDLIALEGAGA
jgi:hypothetical protein